MTHAFRTCLEALELGTPIQALNLSVFPLTEPDPMAQKPFLKLDDALEQGLLEVAEMNDAGSISELRVHNLSDKPVLLLDGEELVGALQNRVLNITILIPPESEIVAPVSCVEMGRWSRRSASFQSGGRTMYARGRAEKMGQISRALRDRGSRRSDQRAVWESIANKAAAMGVRSATDAMADIYLKSEERSQAYRALRCPEDARGAVFCVDGEPVGLEVMDSAGSFSAVFPKLLESYAMDALEKRALDQALPEKDEAQSMIDAIGNASIEHFPALGMGEDLRLESSCIVGGGLVVDDALVQLTAFAQTSSARTAKR